MNSIFSATDVSASGLAAERLRMEVVANNIANAHSTRSPEGGPFRRQQVVFASVLDSITGQLTKGASQLGGVEVVQVRPDMSDLPQVYQPGHPDANQEGFVTMPNVNVAGEMVDLITAQRAYEANLRSLRSFREMVEQTLSLLRGV